MTATTCTVGPNAVTGERCGRPAVFTFGENGEFGECAEHSTAHVAPTSRAGSHFVGERVTVRRHGRDFAAVVTHVGARGAAFATFTFGNGVERTVRVED